MKIVITNDGPPLSLLENVKLRGALMSSLSKFRDRIPRVEIRIGASADSSSQSGKRESITSNASNEPRNAACRIIASLKNTGVAMVSTTNDDDFDSILLAIQRLRNRIDRLIQEQPASHQTNPFNFGFST